MYMPLRAADHPHPINFDFFSVSRLPRNLMLEFLNFSPTAGSLYDYM